MSKRIKNIVIAGGGSAGWLTAGLLAAEHCTNENPDVHITLVESPDITPIGVGEGTWPTMRTSLQAVGVSETDFIRQCDASFKQGTRFNAWLDGGDEAYYHPFALPPRFHEIDLARHWQPLRDQVSYAAAVTPQASVCEKALAPKQITTPEYAGNLNYGYHLDAGKFSTFLQEHCVKNLSVRHVLENIVQVNAQPDGDIASLTLQSGDVLEGDLFVDCTGFAALLIGKHFNVSYRSVQNFLFNDRALAAQIGYRTATETMASTTHSTAKRAGWIWDIALPTRRGTGYVYSSAHTDDEQAEADLRSYLASTSGEDASRDVSVRSIRFEPGHREELWHRNCVAVGLSGGFVEPLEASALVMIEQSAKMLAEQLPATREVMDIVARGFNRRFLYHWKRIVGFLKLHYVLSHRTDSDYWRDNRATDSTPDELLEALELWRYRSPRFHDLPLADELFPAASYRYVLNGMHFDSEQAGQQRHSDIAARSEANQLFSDNATQIGKLLRGLPTNRELIDKIHEYGLQKV